MKNLLHLITLCITISSCSGLQKTAKKDLNEGFYTQNIKGAKQSVYINIEDDTMLIYTVKSSNHKPFIDTNKVFERYHKVLKADFNPPTSFSRTSLDIDFLTIPLKYRTAQSNIPPQLNTNLNGAAYLGYRTDRYKLNYITNPLGKAKRMINHFGFSFGAFTGGKSSQIDPLIPV